MKVDQKTTSHHSAHFAQIEDAESHSFDELDRKMKNYFHIFFRNAESVQNHSLS